MTEVTSLFKYTRRFFDLPGILDHGYYNPNLGEQPPIPVVFLIRASPESRKTICQKIKAGNGLPWPEDLPRPSLGIVPWLRSYEPEVNAIFRLVKNVDNGNLCMRRLIFVDKEGMESGTCLIWHHLYGSTEDDPNVEKHELARVDVGRAYQLVVGSQPQNSWFPDVLSNDCEVVQPAVEPEEKWACATQESEANNVENGTSEEKSSEIDIESEDDWEMVEPVTEKGVREESQRKAKPKSNEDIEKDSEKGYRWPDHIPQDFKLEEERPTIIALNHLKPSQIDELIEDIGKDERYPAVNIINWTSTTRSMASEAAMWNIVDQIRPTWEKIAPYGESFCFFLESRDSEPKQKPRLLLAKRRKAASHVTASDIEEILHTENTMPMDFVPAEAFWKLWKAAWNPSGEGYYNDVRYNSAIAQLGRTIHSWEYMRIHKPEVPVLYGCDGIPIFVLQPMEPMDEFKMRGLFQVGGPTAQFIHVPNGDGTIKQLMNYFQSPSWVSYHIQPPRDFVAIDDAAVKSITFTKGEPSFLLGTTLSIWHEQAGHFLALDHVGYAVGRARMENEDEYLSWNGAANRAGLGGYIGLPDGDVREAEGSVELHYWYSWMDENGDVDEELVNFATVMS